MKACALGQVQDSPDWARTESNALKHARTACIDSGAPAHSDIPNSERYTYSSCSRTILKGCSLMAILKRASNPAFSGFVPARRPFALARRALNYANLLNTHNCARKNRRNALFSLNNARIKPKIRPNLWRYIDSHNLRTFQSLQNSG